MTIKFINQGVRRVRDCIYCGEPIYIALVELPNTSKVRHMPLNTNDTIHNCIAKVITRQQEQQVNTPKG